MALVLAGPQAQAATFAPGSVSVSAVSSSAATLGAVVIPEGVSTTYVFVYAKEGESLSGPGAQTAPLGGADAGSGTVGVSVSVHLQGLLPGTEYQFAPQEAVLSESPRFRTQGLGGGFGLPDGRAWELVTPVDKLGAGLKPPPKEGGLVEAAADGAGITYIASGPTAEPVEGNRSLEVVQSLARRGSGGWTSQDLTTPSLTLGQFVLGDTAEYKQFSEDLSTALVEPPGDTPLPPLPADAEKTIYLRDNLANSFTPLVSATNVPPGTQFGLNNNHLESRGASGRRSGPQRP